MYTYIHFIEKKRLTDNEGFVNNKVLLPIHMMDKIKSLRGSLIISGGERKFTQCQYE